MMDPIQLVLLLVIVILTILLVILGVQVFLILREVRRTLSKANTVIENVSSITEHMKDPFNILSSLGLRAGSIITVIKLVKNLLGREKDTDEKRNRES